MRFPLHTYIRHLRDDGASEEYIRAIRKNAEPLVNNGLPVILTLEHLARVIALPTNVLNGIINRQIDPYRVFAIRKRNGGKRFICIPEPNLLGVQRWIHEHILCSPSSLKKLPCNATAYIPSSSHIANAKWHIGAAWVLKLDIKHFFESISERQVYKVFWSLGYRKQVAFYLTRLCTRVLPASSDKRLQRRIKRWQPGCPREFLNGRIVGHLPQGAPTSPMLANLVCIGLDAELQKIASREGLTYTRYADDMVFSGDIVNRGAAITITREVSTVVGHYGFGINVQKTNIVKNGSRKIVTGLSIDGDVVRVPRIYKDKIRQELHYLKKFGLKSHCDRIGQENHLSYLLRLAGRIRYVVSVEPDIGNKLMGKFRQLFPDFGEIEQLIL